MITRKAFKILIQFVDTILKESQFQKHNTIICFVNDKSKAISYEMLYWIELKAITK